MWDNISVRWTGQIRSPSFETCTINIEKNRAYILTIAGSSTMDDSSTNEHTQTEVLTANTPYDFYIAVRPFNPESLRTRQLQFTWETVDYNQD